MGLKQPWLLWWMTSTKRWTEGSGTVGSPGSLSSFQSINHAILLDWDWEVCSAVVLRDLVSEDDSGELLLSPLAFGPQYSILPHIFFNSYLKLLGEDLDWVVGQGSYSPQFARPEQDCSQRTVWGSLIHRVGK